MPHKPMTPNEKRMPQAGSPDRMPGGEAALPKDALPKPFLGPQGDENRRPPPGSPAPVSPAPVVERQLPPAPKRQR
jgi:hypothetical protein